MSVQRTTENAAQAEWAKVLYSVDLSCPEPVVVQATRTASGPELAEITMSELKTALQPGDGAIVAGFISQNSSFTRWLTAPFASRQKAVQVLPSLLDIQIPFPLEECLCEFMVSGQSDGESTRALAVAARNTDLESTLEIYSRHDLDPAIIDQESLALWDYSLEQRPLNTGSTRVLVSLSNGRATVIVGTGQEFASAHNVRQTVADIDRLVYAQLRDTPQNLEWAWSGAEANAAEALKAELIEKWPGSSFTHEQPGSFLANAVAVRAMTRGNMRCNLRKDHLQHSAMIERQQHLSIRSASAVLAAGLIIIAVNAGMRGIAEHRLELAKDGIYSRIEQIAGYEITARGDDAVTAMKRALARQNKNTEPFLDAFEAPLTSSLRSIISVSGDHGLKLQSLLLRRESLAISGTAGNWAQCESYLKQLKLMGFDASLKRESSANGGNVLFTITAGGAR